MKEEEQWDSRVLRHSKPNKNWNSCSDKRCVSHRSYAWVKLPNSYHLVTSTPSQMSAQNMWWEKSLIANFPTTLRCSGVVFLQWQWAFYLCAPKIPWFPLLEITCVSSQTPSQHIFSCCRLTTKQPFSYSCLRQLLPSHHALFVLVHYLMGNMAKSGRQCNKPFQLNHVGDG